MTTTKATKLTATLQKSYYGKAKLRKEGNAVILTSYATDVARIEGGKIFRLWSGWSSTTAKHVNDFCKQYGLPTLNKSEWMAMPCENPESVYQITQSNGFCSFTGQALLTATECEREAEKIRRARGNRVCVWYD